jgi:hypothetical protein
MHCTMLEGGFPHGNECTPALGDCVHVLNDHWSTVLYGYLEPYNPKQTSWSDVHMVEDTYGVTLCFPRFAIL